MHLKALSAILLASGSLTACANFKPPAIDYDNDPAPAVLAGDPPKPVKVVAVPTPLPLPGQLKPLPAGKPVPEPKDPAVRVATANEAARVQLSMAETNCARWRRESVPVRLREKGCEAPVYF